jgi:hypothetical protein
MMQVVKHTIHHMNHIVRIAKINCCDYIVIRIQYTDVNNGKASDGTANDVNIPGWMKKLKR